MSALTIASLTSSPRSITCLAWRPVGVPAATASRSMSPVDSCIGCGAIFDGFPRTQAQAEALDLLLAERGRHLDHVIELVVDEDELVRRIVGRFTCANCGAPYHDELKRPQVEGVCDVCGSTEFKRRPDDNEQTVRTRMAEYRAKTAPILPFYEQRGLVRRVDGMASVEDVAAQIDAILDG